MHALLVDDDPISVEFLRTWLQDRAWRVSVAGTLAHMEAQLSNDVDWLILDRRLPDGDGTDWLRERLPTLAIARVLILSGDPLDGQLPAGITCLRKPVNPDQLLALLEDSGQPAASGVMPTDELVDLDDTAALRVVNGRSEVLAILRSMLRKEIAAIDWLEDLGNNERAYARLTQVHRLRGATAMTGATRSAAAAERVETALRQGALPTSAEICELGEALRALLERLPGTADMP